MNQVAVLGAGGVGGLVAAALTRAGLGVTVVAREPTAEVIAREGLTVRSRALGDFSAAPVATTSLDETVDLLVVATKATGLSLALARVRAQPRLVVPLLNGIEHLDVLRERFGERAVAGVIRVESDRPVPGRIVQTSPAVRIDVASDDPARRPALESLVSELEAAGIDSRIGDSEAQVMWAKLVRLNALAATTAASDRPLGFVRDDPAWSAVLAGCVAEGAAVARAEGARIEDAAVMAELDEAHPELGSSLQRDLRAGRESELDHICGAVLRAGARHGLECATVGRLAETIARRADGPAPS